MNEPDTSTAIVRVILDAAYVDDADGELIPLIIQLLNRYPKANHGAIAAWLTEYVARREKEKP